MSLNPPLEKASARLIGSDADSFPMPSRSAEALADLAAGFSRSWIWSRLAYQDIKLRYRGSVLGPFWVTLTNLVMIVAMGTIYSSLFHTEMATYLPYVMVGLLIWQFISGLIVDGCATFTAAADVIQQVPMPFSVQAYRVIYRNLLLLAHNAIIIPFGLAIFAVPVTWHLLDVVPALVVLSVNGLWITLLLGTISARLRDIPPIVANIVQVVFFLTPMFWPMHAISGDHLKQLLILNPFFAALDVMRAPLLGLPPEPTSWPILLACTVIGSLCGFAFFIRFRERITYWI
jgi:ABC-type polysaccharide/polyol phosphate export permease